MAKRATRKLKRRFDPATEDGLVETFAAVFHSFRDLHKVTPLAFIAKLKKRGVVLAPRPHKGQPK